MKRYFVISSLFAVTICVAQPKVNRNLIELSPSYKTNSTARDQDNIKVVLDQMDYELKLVLASDTVALKKLYPDDMVVTNPFNQLINKRNVIERIKSNVIKYDSMKKVVEYIHSEGGDVLTVIGVEVVRPSVDSTQPRAGTTFSRRFTEVYLKRGNGWWKVIRHSNEVK